MTSGDVPCGPVWHYWQSIVDGGVSLVEFMHLRVVLQLTCLPGERYQVIHVFVVFMSGLSSIS